MQSLLNQPLFFAGLVFVLTLSAAALGFWLHRGSLLDGADEMVLLAGGSAIGLAATLTAVVLGLVTASAADEFDQANRAVATAAADVLELNAILDSYGPDAAPARDQLRSSVRAWADQLASGQAPGDEIHGRAADSHTEVIFADIADLKPTTDLQSALRSRALELVGNQGDVVQNRWFFTVRPSSLPPAFLLILLVWMVIEFFSFGLTSPRRAVVYLLIAVAALVISSAMFLVLELRDPIAGFIRVSSDPLNQAYAMLSE